ncbi:MAG: hypothetical protein LBD16_05885 [Oscillospiraceae bacterium]|jgi:hypothetical protein|nr:hypothetical protein [Oscillospiraceae bacterium]
MLEKLKNWWRKAVPAIIFRDEKKEDPYEDRYEDDLTEEEYEDDAEDAEDAESAEEEYSEEQDDDYEDTPRKKRRSVNGAAAGGGSRIGYMHTPHIRGGTLEERRAAASAVIENDYNALILKPDEGELIVIEKGEDGAETSVSVGLKLLDQRVKPVWSGIVDVIRDSGGGSASPSDPPNPLIERPYMVESGQNTFLWYRQSKRLDISREKTMDEQGLILSAGSVTLHVGCLGDEALSLFEKLLSARSNIIRI